MNIMTPSWTSRNFSSDMYDKKDSIPACEISESDGHYFMIVDLPGMKKETLKIEILKKVLTISSKRKREFKRSIALPANVDVEQVQARYENGVLEVYLPKTSSSAKPRIIEIQGEDKPSLFDKLLGAKHIKNKDTKNLNSVNIAP